MFSVGFGEWLVLLAVILVVVGPKRLPEAARKFGNWYARIRRAANAFRHELMDIESAAERGGDDAVKLVEGAFTVPEEKPDGPDQKS